MQSEQSIPSVLTIEQQKKISLTGVGSVDSFSETEITLTVNGKKLKIFGAHLKVLAFSQGSGNFAACGEITALKFGARKGKFFQRLLK